MKCINITFSFFLIEIQCISQLQVISCKTNFCISSLLICLVFFLLMVHVNSYPSVREIATDDEENNNDLELKLRSLLNYLDNEKIERSVASG
jgi:hypothetical protein